MSKNTELKIKTINLIVEKFKNKFPYIDIYPSSNNKRICVSKSKLDYIKYYIYRSEASYSRKYNTGRNAYRVYISSELEEYILRNIKMFKKYKILKNYKIVNTTVLSEGVVNEQ